MITSVEIQTFCYPTEDLEKVKRAFLAISPVEPEITKTTTHFHTDMLVLKARIKGKKIRDFLARLSRLSREEKNEILNTLDSRIDEKGNLYIRLDKFKALEGEVSLARKEPILVVIKFTTYPFDREKVLEEAKDVL